MDHSNKVEASKRVVEETKRLYFSLLNEQLDERQLLRPPFKFIHDLMRKLISKTKSLRDLFNAAEFELAAKKSRAWDRRAKIEFVQRLIDFVANNKQPIVGCVASKVISGLEPNKTNELLQSIARIATRRSAGPTTSSANNNPIPASSNQAKRPQTFTKQNSSDKLTLTPSRKLSTRPGKGSGQQVNEDSRTLSATAVGQLDKQRSSLQFESLDQSVGSSLQGSPESPRGRGGSIITSPPPVVEPSKAVGGGMKQQKLVLAAVESDLAKGVQLVRTQLKALRTSLMLVGKTEDFLRERLIITLAQDH